MKRVKPKTGVRDAYARVGVKKYYETHAATYVNPHAPQVGQLVVRNHEKFDCSAVLDLACGNGEVTVVLQRLGYTNMVGCDPYTAQSYRNTTGCECFTYSFDDLLKGKLPTHFSSVICSFGLHLVEESKLPVLLQQLNTDTIVIITPHKRPLLEKYGLHLVFEDAVLTDKGKSVRLKIYKK